MAAVLGLERMYFGDDFGDDALERIVLVDKLLLLIAEVAARLGAFDHDGVGNVLIFCKPFLAQQFRGARRRYDGCQFGFGSFGKERRQVERQPGAREDDVRLLGDGGSDHVGEIGHGDHDVHADDAFRGLAGLFQFLFQPPDRGRTVIFRIVFVNHSQAGDEMTPMPPWSATAEASPASDMPTPIPPCTMGTGASKFPIFNAFILLWISANLINRTKGTKNKTEHTISHTN